MTFTHDCPNCISLGLGLLSDSQDGADFYVCAKPPYALSLGPSLVIRYGNRPSEYVSSPWQYVDASTEGLSEAKHRVEERVSEIAASRISSISSFLYSPLTPQFLVYLGETATRRILHEDNSEWFEVFRSLHFIAKSDSGGNVTLELHGGAGV